MQQLPEGLAILDLGKSINLVSPIELFYDPNEPFSGKAFVPKMVKARKKGGEWQEELDAVAK